MTDAELAAQAAKRLERSLLFIAKVLNVKKTEVETILDATTASNQLSEKFDEVIEANVNEGFENGRSKVLGMAIKGLKQLGFEFKEKVTDLDKNFFTKLDEQVKAKTTSVEGDDDGEGGSGKAPVNESAVVKKLNDQIAKLKSEKQELLDNHTTEIEQINTNNAKALRLVEVKSLAPDALRANRAIVPADAEIAKEKLARFQEDLAKHDYEVDAKSGKRYLLDAEGNRVKQNGHPVDVDAYMGKLVDIHYGRLKADPKQGGGLPDDKQDGSGGDGGSGGNTFEFKVFKGTAPANQAELNKYLDDPKTPWDQQSELIAYSKTVALPDPTATE